MASSIVASSLYAGMHMLTPAVYRWREIVSICCSGTTSINSSRQAAKRAKKNISTFSHLGMPFDIAQVMLCVFGEIRILSDSGFSGRKEGTWSVQFGKDSKRKFVCLPAECFPRRLPICEPPEDPHGRR